MKRHSLANALRVAAETFDNDAVDQPERISEQFTRQAREARLMADEIDRATTIRLED